MRMPEARGGLFPSEMLLLGSKLGCQTGPRAPRAARLVLNERRASLLECHDVGDWACLRDLWMASRDRTYSIGRDVRL